MPVLNLSGSGDFWTCYSPSIVNFNKLIGTPVALLSFYQYALSQFECILTDLLNEFELFFMLVCIHGILPDPTCGTTLAMLLFHTN